MNLIIECVTIAIKSIIGLTIITSVVLVVMVVYDTVRRWIK